MKNIIHKLKNKRGETLLEVVVSVAILAILSVAFVTLLMGASNFNLKAIRVYKEDTQIAGKFDGNDFAVISVDNTKKTIGLTGGTEPKPIIAFVKPDGTSATSITMDGTYEVATGKAGENVILKRFVVD